MDGEGKMEKRQIKKERKKLYGKILTYCYTIVTTCIEQYRILR